MCACPATSLLMSVCRSLTSIHTKNTFEGKYIFERLWKARRVRHRTNNECSLAFSKKTVSLKRSLEPAISIVVRLATKGVGEHSTEEAYSRCYPGGWAHCPRASMRSNAEGRATVSRASYVPNTRTWRAVPIYPQQSRVLAAWT